MKEEPVIEKNDILAKKNYSMQPIISNRNFRHYKQSIQNHPLITEARETANAINEYLNQLILAVYTANYYLQYCKQSIFGHIFSPT